MKVGMQIYTVRDSFYADPMKCLEDVAAEGYKYIEMVNHTAHTNVGVGCDLSAEELKKKADSLGIQIVGGHLASMDPKVNIFEDTEYAKRILDYYAGTGAKYICILSCREIREEADVQRRCDDFNAFGKLCKEYGIKMIYHNHWQEFHSYKGKTLYDYMMENTDPELMSIELDTYWAVRALVDPVDIINKYGSRIELLHQKDYPLNVISELDIWQSANKDDLFDQFQDEHTPRFFTEIGKGILKIQDYIDAGNENGVPYMIVEQDFSELGEIPGIRASMNNFKKMRGLEWN